MAMALPMPRLAPVTSPIWPSNFMAGVPASIRSLHTFRLFRRSRQGRLFQKDSEYGNTDDEQGKSCVKPRVKPFLRSPEADLLHIETEKAGTCPQERSNFGKGIPKGFAHPNIPGILARKKQSSYHAPDRLLPDARFGPAIPPR
jgi:hypothetical protein